MDQGVFRVGKVFISITNPQDAEKRITEAAYQGKGGFVCVSNMRMVMFADKHPDYAKLMSRSFMNLPDGMPLTWCGRLWGIGTVNRICGPDLFESVLSRDDLELKHYLLGDTQEVLDRIVAKFNCGDKKKIVGAYSLPFAKVEEFDYEGISKMVNESGANIVWTAMTAPKQDEFDERLLKLTPKVVAIGVGRAFRASIGEYKEVPNYARKLGISGFWLLKGTLWQEFRFYFSAFFFLIKVFLQILLRKICGKRYYE